MEKLFTIATQGTGDILYEDNTCVVELGAADFRDPCWYIGMGAVIDKETQERRKLTLLQKKVLFQRISYELHQKLYTDEFKFIWCEDKDIIEAKLMGLLKIKD